MSTATARTLDVVALNADVVGYSRLLADDFEATTSLMGEFRAMVEDEVAASDGVLVNFAGDNFMAVFTDARNAMASAIAITTAIEVRNRDVAEVSQLRFRMGLDQGSVTVQDDQYFGDALNIAARIQAISPAGGLGVSGRVYRSLDEPELRFQPIGRRALKNIPEEVEVFEFVGLPTEGTITKRFDTLSLATPTVAVLPIHADDLDPALRPIAAVVRDDLIHRLAQVPRLHVVNATAESEGSAPANVRYMLETGVHQVGNQVRVYAKLLDVTTMNIVNTNRWTAPTEDLMSLSEDVAEGVARSLAIELVIGEPAGFYNELGDPEALQNIYTGWYHLTSGTPEGIDRAAHYFGEVAKSHPDLPYGHVLSAFTYLMAGSEAPTPRREALLGKAVENAQVGIDLGDPTGLAHTVMAATYMFRGDPEQAMEWIDSNEIARPTCDVTYAVEGSVRRYMGDWKSSLDLIDKALRLTAAANPWYHTVQACSLFMGGRLEDAAAAAQAVVEAQPTNLEALLVLAASQVEMGMDRRARATADLIQERFPAVDVDGWLAETPYQQREMLERWKNDLVSAGIIESEPPPV